ncbi:MAG: sugar phosphate nucleotidyltransferase [Pseudanabaenaceae cyanobacterium]
MQAIIIAGGKGTRIRPLSYGCPKPLLPMLGRPFLAWMVWRCVQAGITNILINVHYQAQQVIDYFGNGSKWGAEINYIVENEPLDTAGAILVAQPKLTGETLLVFNADILTDLDLRQLIDWHKQHKADATLTLTRVTDIRPYGLVELAGDQILAFREKPNDRQAEEFLARGINTINAGTYVLEPQIFQHYTTGEPLSFERVVFPQTLAYGYKITGFVWDGYWLDLGTPAKYYQGQLDILQGKLRIPWFDLQEQAQEISPHIWTAKTANINSSAQLFAPCWIGHYSQIGANAVIPSGTIVGDYCLVDRPLSAGIYGNFSVFTNLENL